MPQPPLVISYQRFSSANQIGNDSIRRQVEASEAYCAERGWKLDQTLQDEAFSAYHGDHRKRGDLAGLLASVKAGQIPVGSVLICEAHDRLSRENVLDAMQQFISIINAGITVVTLQDRKEYNKATISDSGGMDLMISLLLMVKANRESSDKSKRIKAVLAQNRKDGKKSGRAPLWMEKKGNDYVLIPERVKVVRRAIQMFIDGSGTNRIMRIFNKEKVGTFNGNMWTANTVSKLLHNHALYGCRFYRTHNEYKEGIYPAVITKAEYLKITNLLNAKASVRGRLPDEFNNIFCGMIYCGSCGGRMTFHKVSLARGRPKPAHYCCFNFERKANCKVSNFTTFHLLERLVIEWLIPHQGEYLKPIDEPSKNDTLRMLIDEKEREYNKHKKAYEKSSDPPDFLIDKIKFVESELKNLRSKLNTKSTNAVALVPTDFASLSKQKQHSILLQVFNKVLVTVKEEMLRVQFQFKNGAYGELFFNKKTDSLVTWNADAQGNLKESSSLLAAVQNPQALKLMLDEGKITQEAYTFAMARLKP